MVEPVITVEVLADLLDRRWALVPAAISEPVVATLVTETPQERIAEVSPSDSAVSYHSASAGRTIDAAPKAVRDLAARLEANLTSACPPGLGVPPFTDATWNWYDPGIGHISSHRDPPSVGGVIAVFTLAGSATFTITDEGEFVVTPGSLVLLAGNEWPLTGGRCVRHGASVPRDQERLILTLRHNRRGSGEGFF